MDIRCFAAITLPETVKNRLWDAVAVLRDIGCDIKWVSKENLHLTMKFLGYVPEVSVKEIESKLMELSITQQAFNFKLKGTGIFPDNKNPRIIWIGISEGKEELASLQKKIDIYLSTIGFKKENKPFSAHITMGRIRSNRGMASLISTLETLKNLEFANIEAQKISLMRSDLKPTGAQYSTIAEFNLKKEKL